MAEIAGEGEYFDVRIGGGELFQVMQGAVGAAVVDEDDFVVFVEGDQDGG